MKKIRLEIEFYAQECHPCHITICSFGGQCLFVHRSFTIHCMDLLESLCKKYELFLYAFCFMPDHIHFIISVRGKRSILSLVQAFKSKATIDSREFGFNDRIFQPRFYDHFPRTLKDLENEIQYILENPVRKALVNENSEYPYSKCFL